MSWIILARSLELSAAPQSCNNFSTRLPSSSRSRSGAIPPMTSRSMLPNSCLCSRVLSS